MSHPEVVSGSELGSFARALRALLGRRAVFLNLLILIVILEIIFMFSWTVVQKGP